MDIHVQLKTETQEKIVLNQRKLTCIFNLGQAVYTEFSAHNFRYYQHVQEEGFCRLEHHLLKTGSNGKKSKTVQFNLSMPSDKHLLVICLQGQLQIRKKRRYEQELHLKAEQLTLINAGCGEYQLRLPSSFTEFLCIGIAQEAFYYFAPGKTNRLSLLNRNAKRPFQLASSCLFNRKIVKILKNMTKRMSSHPLGKLKELTLKVYCMKIIFAYYELLDTDQNLDFLESLVDRAVQNIRSDLKLKVETDIDKLANEIGCAPELLTNAFKQVKNFTPKQYIREIVLENATEQLVSTNLTCKEIFANTNYIDINSFNRIFKKKYGCTMVEYRKKFSQ